MPGFEISINDVTQEEEQVRLKRQLTQNIAHELKTPVSSTQGYLETIVSNENIPREKINVFLERCYAQSNRLSRLLRDISVLTRMDEAASMIDMERVDISVLVGNIINEVSLELDEKHITVVTSLKKSIQIKGNYSLLYSIFRNLMDNAIAYAGSNIRSISTVSVKMRNFYYFRLCRHRYWSISRTSESSLRTFLPGRQRSFTESRWNRTGTSYCEERRHHPRWQHLRQEQSGRRAGICIYIGKGEVKSGVILQNLSNQKN